MLQCRRCKVHQPQLQHSEINMCLGQWIYVILLLLLIHLKLRIESFLPQLRTLLRESDSHWCLAWICFPGATGPEFPDLMSSEVHRGEDVFLRVRYFIHRGLALPGMASRHPNLSVVGTLARCYWYSQMDEICISMFRSREKKKKREEEKGSLRSAQKGGDQWAGALVLNKQN